jgi:glucuronate isomerase
LFLDEDFLLGTPLARTLFHEYAESLPIVDYHCHLNPPEIVDDECFSGIVEAWLGAEHYGDHYKWRLMRANGVPERLITGDGSDWEKFEAFAATMERAVGNPVYLWTHLELRRIFGINEDLTRASARRIFDRCNALLASPEFSRRSLIRKFGVELVCTTDDPADALAQHQALAGEAAFKVVPAFRPDRALYPERPGFAGWLARLEQCSGQSITSFAELVAALSARVDYFHELGARLSDHGLDVIPGAAPAGAAQLDATLTAARDGARPLATAELESYRAALIGELMGIYRAKGWTMQWHVNATRNLNTEMFAALGADTGFDGMRDEPVIEPLISLLASAAGRDALPRTIVYSLNPGDWLPLTALVGCFQGQGEQQLQLGNAWWFNDTRSGIRRQLTTMAEQSLLANAIGMTTDSRSFLSYPRHEYFRRILCELLGEWASRGEITSDLSLLGQLVRRVSYENAKALFAG